MTELIEKITVLITDHAKSTGIEYVKPQLLRIRFTKLPAAKQLNQVVTKILARHYHLPVNHVVLEHGENERKKQFLIIPKA